MSGETVFPEYPQGKNGKQARKDFWSSLLPQSVIKTFLLDGPSFSFTLSAVMDSLTKYSYVPLSTTGAFSRQNIYRRNTSVDLPPEFLQSFSEVKKAANILEDTSNYVDAAIAGFLPLLPSDYDRPTDTRDQVTLFRSTEEPTVNALCYVPLPNNRRRVIIQNKDNIHATTILFEEQKKGELLIEMTKNLPLQEVVEEVKKEEIDPTATRIIVFKRALPFGGGDGEEIPQGVETNLSPVQPEQLSLQDKQRRAS